MRRFPEPISNLVATFARLPGVGPKTALRYVYYLLKQPKADLDVMARALVQLGERIRVCSVCFTYTEQEVCDICQDPKRNRAQICVVEESRDISTIESTNVYTGLYHVLGGNLNPIEGMIPDTIRIRELKEKLELDNHHRNNPSPLPHLPRGSNHALPLQTHPAPWTLAYTPSTRVTRGGNIGICRRGNLGRCDEGKETGVRGIV